MNTQSFTVGMMLVITMNAPAKEPTLPSDSVDLRKAVQSAEAVMVVRFTGFGTPDFGPPGEMVYQGATAQVQKSMKGTQNKQLSCSFRLRTFPPDKKEELPQVNVDYILTGSSSSGDFEATKVISATQDNLKLVADLIGSPSSSSIESATSATSVSSEPVEKPSETKKINESKPPTTTPSEEPASSTPWSIIVVLIVAVTGLLWLLHKKRK